MHIYICQLSRWNQPKYINHSMTCIMVFLWSVDGNWEIQSVKTETGRTKTSAVIYWILFSLSVFSASHWAPSVKHCSTQRIHSWIWCLIVLKTCRHITNLHDEVKPRYVTVQTACFAAGYIGFSLNLHKLPGVPWHTFVFFVTWFLFSSV